MPNKNKASCKSTSNKRRKSKPSKKLSYQVEWSKYKRTHSKYAPHYKFHSRQQNIKCNHCYQRFWRIKQCRFYLLNDHVKNYHKTELNKWKNRKHKKTQSETNKTKTMHYGLFLIDDAAGTIIKRCHKSKSNKNTRHKKNSAQPIAYLQQSEIWYWSLTMQIDYGLSRYYHHKGAQYKCNHIGHGQFIEWCALNNYDTDTVLYELQISPNMCSLIEFDHNFPIDEINCNKKYEIFNVIKCCAIDPYAFTNSAEITLNKQTQIDCGLGRYYKHHAHVDEKQYFDTNGVGKFKEWCGANGYDTDSIEGDLELGPLEGCVVEFDSNFPTQNAAFDIIKACWKNSFAYIKDKKDSVSNKYCGSIYRVYQVVRTIRKFGYSEFVITNTLNVYFNNQWTADSTVILRHFREEHMDYIVRYIQRKYEPILKPFDDNIDMSCMDAIQLPFKMKPLSFMCEMEVVNWIECYIRTLTNDGIRLPCDVMRICCSFCNCIDYCSNNNNWSKDIEPVIKNSNEHMFDYKVSLNNPIILGKSNVLQINVLFDMTLENESWNVSKENVPKISNESDIVLNILGDLKIGRNGCITASQNGSIFINVKGDIELTSTAVIECIAGSGDIYIKCRNLKLRSDATIYTGNDVYIHSKNLFDYQGKIECRSLKIKCIRFSTSKWNKMIASGKNIMINTWKWVTTYVMLTNVHVKFNATYIREKVKFKYRRFQIKMS